MSYGLNLIGAGASHVLSSEWHLLKFVGKGTLVENTLLVNHNTSPPYITTYYRVYSSPTLTVSDSCPTIFYYMADETHVAMGSMWKVDSTHWRVGYYTGSAYMDIYFFEEIKKSRSSDSYGMLLYDATNNLIFDSGWDKADVLHLKSVHSLVANAGNSITISSSVSKPAFFFYSSYVWLEKPNAYDNFAWVLGLKRASNVYTTKLLCTLYHRYTYGSYNAYLHSDGTTHSVPVIDGADYD